MHRNEPASLQRPAEPGGGETEARRGGNADKFVRRHMRGQQRADPVEKGIARGQHADRRAAPRENSRDGIADRRGPSQRVAGHRRREGKVPRTPDDERGLRKERSRGKGKTVAAVFADTDDGEPGVGRWDHCAF